MRDLRARISDVAQEIDAHKAKTGAAMGGAVFLFLLALGAGYDLLSGKVHLWATFGIGDAALRWVAFGLAAASLLLFALAAVSERGRDRDKEALLDDLEQELAELSERQEMIEGQSNGAS
ncbi:MAG TPA: hypothetical protein VJQ56_03110 [Blastocatellia bacterium]|nr:hypothetical protein [Blastocatellia bacterium]